MVTSNFKIEPFSKNDWPIISLIYKEGIDTSMATFETLPPTWEQWNSSHIESCRLKATIGDEIAGWAALSPTSTREVYKGVAEVSIYITSKYRKLGVGKLLLSRLIHESEHQGFWTLQAGIFRENAPSIALHKSLGFREIGYREKIGKLNGIWFDNIILERRTKTIL